MHFSFALILKPIPYRLFNSISLRSIQNIQIEKRVSKENGKKKEKKLFSIHFYVVVVAVGMFARFDTIYLMHAYT